MKNLLFVFFLFVSVFAFGQQKAVTKIVDASCGQCQFDMKGKKGCDLAVRIDGKAYFVEGVKIDDHGDAHAKHGYCNAVRKAEVTGAVKGDKFVATSFRLVDEKK